MITLLAVTSVGAVLLYATGTIGSLLSSGPTWWSRSAVAGAGLLGCLCLVGFFWLMAGAA